MPSLGLSELIVVGVIILVFIGPERLPHAARSLGRMYGRMRRAADELQRAFVMEADRIDEEERLRALREKRAASLDKLKAEAEAQAGEGTRAQPGPLPVDGPEEDPPEASLPPGFSPEEWEELPDHVKEIVQRRRAGGEG
jgi:sec-independent protein translocase protein TatB